MIAQEELGIRIATESSKLGKLGVRAALQKMPGKNYFL